MSSVPKGLVSGVSDPKRPDADEAPDRNFIPDANPESINDRCWTLEQIQGRVTPHSYPRTTMNAQQRALVAKELEAIPSGGPDQNMYRMVYEQVRLNGLGSDAQVEATPQAAHEFALRTVQRHHSDFRTELK